MLIMAKELGFSISNSELKGSIPTLNSRLSNLQLRLHSQNRISSGQHNSKTSEYAKLAYIARRSDVFDHGLLYQSIAVHALTHYLYLYHNNLQEKSNHISKYRIYDLVLEYSRRVSTPPPLSLIHHFIRLLAWLVRKISGKKIEDHPFMKKIRNLRHDEQGEKDWNLQLKKKLEPFSTEKFQACNGPESNIYIHFVACILKERNSGAAPRCFERLTLSTCANTR